MSDNSPIRILLIEDDQRRVDRFRSWLPDEIQLVVARSAGQAMGLLRRVNKGDYAGIMLDHDLQEQAITADDTKLSGTDLIDVVIQNIDRETPVLIHSTNLTRAPMMAERLKRADYWVTQVSMLDLTAEVFCEWVGDVRSLYQDS